LDISPETAPRLVAMAEVDMEVNRVDMEVVAAAALADVKVDKLATLVVVTDTCQETAPRVRNATTAERLAT
jgi:hypothetical protein